MGRLQIEKPLLNLCEHDCLFDIATFGWTMDVRKLHFVRLGNSKLWLKNAVSKSNNCVVFFGCFVFCKMGVDGGGDTKFHLETTCVLAFVSNDCSWSNNKSFIGEYEITVDAVLLLAQAVLYGWSRLGLVSS